MGVLVETVRLLITLAATAAGYRLGPMATGLAPELGTVWGAVLGAGVGYVGGGIVGRGVRRLFEEAPDRFPDLGGPELYAGGFGVVVGVVVGAALSAPLVALLPPEVGWPLAVGVVLVIAALAGRLFAARAGDLLGTRRLGRRPVGGTLIDTSAAIDGRVVELARAGLLEAPLVVPAFVVDELQTIADAGDPGRRRRGRRGLGVLEALADLDVGFAVGEDEVPEQPEVDAKLLVLAERTGATLVTTDANLARAGRLRGIEAVNPHELSEALRPAIVPGEHVVVLIDRPGSEPDQGVGFLDDGTMVVVNDAADSIGETLEVEVSNMVRTQAGRLVFARPLR